MDNVIYIVALLLIIAIVIFVFLIIANKTTKLIVFGKKVTLAFVIDDKNKLYEFKNKQSFTLYYDGYKKKIKENPTTLYFPDRRTTLLICNENSVIRDNIIIDQSRSTEYLIKINGATTKPKEDNNNNQQETK